MKKVVYADANEELFRACSGRMTFLIENTRNIKEASSASVTKEMCEQFKPDKDHFACLQIALGDYETYGHNRNADSFPKEANIKYHDTFVKCAKVYREHANKDPKKAIGEIKASFYNPEMHRTELILWGDKKKADKEWDLAKEGKELAGSMGCFVAGTKITKADGSEIDIEDVKLGDKVITHLGNQKEVTALLPHLYSGDLYNIKLSGNYEESKGVTSEHPYLVSRRVKEKIADAEGICPVCGKKVKYLLTHIRRYKDSKHREWFKKYKEDVNKLETKWVPVSEIKLGDFLCEPIYVKSSNRGCLDFAKLCGYFLAEGNFVFYTNSNKEKYPVAIELNFGDTAFEKKLVDDVCLLIGKLSKSKVNVQHRENKHTLRISCYDKKLSEKVFNACGHLCDKKRISDEVLSWNKECLWNLLDCFIAGDGFYDNAHKSVGFSTTSKKLSKQLNQICGLMGLGYNTFKSNLKSGKVSYSTYLSAKNNNLVSKFIIAKGKEIQKSASPETYGTFSDGKYVYREVVGISKSSVENCMVYNFSVEDDESYIANGVAVHNCTIAKDRDNISGKMSASPMEYEPWMKKSAGRFIKEWTMPDGSTKVINKFACVHNDTPKFIDYSFVAHPADRIAYYLEYIPGEKTASAHDDICIPSAMLPESELLNFDTGLFSEPENINTLDTLCKAESDINDYVSANINGNAGNDAIDDILLNSFDTEDECCMSDDDMDKLRALQPNVCMAELAKRGVMLPFEDFVRYAFKQSQNDVKNSPVVVFAKNVILPNAFSFAKENCNSIDNEHMFDAGSNFDCKIDLNNDCATQNVLNSLVDKFSILPEPLVQRAVRIAVKPVKRTFKVRLIKIANATNNGMGLLSKEQLNEANKYIAQYVNYKVAAMKEIGRYHNIDNNKLYLLGITQNARF